MPVPSAIQQNTPSSNDQMISSQNDTELEEVSSQGKTAKGKSYETWSKDEEKLLVDLWVENHKLLESKDSLKMQQDRGEMHSQNEIYNKQI